MKTCSYVYWCAYKTCSYIYWCAYICAYVCVFVQNTTQDLTIIWKHCFENLFIHSFVILVETQTSYHCLITQVANPLIGHINLHQAKLKLETIFFKNISCKTPHRTKQNYERIIYVPSCVRLLETQTSYKSEDNTRC